MSEVIQQPEAPKTKILTQKEMMTIRAEKLRAKIVADTEEYNGLVSALQKYDAIDAVKEGDTVRGTFGRAATARAVEGVVLGVNRSDTIGLQVKIQVGTGFNTEILTLGATQIDEVVPVGTVAAV